MSNVSKNSSSQNSRNPANSDSLAGTLYEVLGKFLDGVDDMLPAVVIAYDREENRATVRPMIQLLQTDGSILSRAEVASVPVLNVGGGLAVLTFNILPGDLGWIKANDRDISLFLQSMTSEGPNTLRKHSFSDSIFIPDQFRKWTLNAEDSEAAVFQSLDGLHRVSIHDNRVQVSSSIAVVLDTPFTNILGDLFVDGSIDVGDEIHAGGTISSNVNVIADSSLLIGHGHPQGPDSAGDSQVDTGPTG